MCETAYWLAISRLPGIGARRALRLKRVFGSGKTIWSASRTDIKYALELSDEKVAAILSAREQVDPGNDLARVVQAGAWVLSWNDTDYPAPLEQLFDPPVVIFGWGEKLMQHERRLAVVGARRMTSYGKQMTNQLITGLADSEAVIISGLAKGVDGEAHRAALKAGLKTWAVLGTGFGRIYPREHKGLAEEIVGADGTVLSEYWPDVGPDAHHFPARNRLIAALANEVLVVEADEKSGSLITVDHALELGRDIWAVPGNATSRFSRGTNGLLKQGASLIARPEDILCEWGLYSADSKGRREAVLPNLEKQEKIVYELLTEQDTQLDEIVDNSGLTTGEVLSVLMSLELAGLIEVNGAQGYRLRVHEQQLSRQTNFN